MDLHASYFRMKYIMSMLNSYWLITITKELAFHLATYFFTSGPATSHPIVIQ